MEKGLKLSMRDCQAMNQQVEDVKKVNAGLMLKIAELEQQVQMKEKQHPPTPVVSKGPEPSELEKMLNSALLRMSDLEEKLKNQPSNTTPEPGRQQSQGTTSTAPRPTSTLSAGTDAQMGDGQEDESDSDDDESDDENVTTPTGQKVSCPNIHGQNSYLHIWLFKPRSKSII